MGPKSPPEPTYFLGENAESRTAALMLRAAGMQCIRMSDAGSEFFKGMLDTAWIPLVAARGWWGVTRDGRTLRNLVEREIILRSGAVHIYVRAQNDKSAVFANALIEAHCNGQLAQFVLARQHPTIVRVQKTGAFKFDDDKSLPGGGKAR